MKSQSNMLVVLSGVALLFLLGMSSLVSASQAAVPASSSSKRASSSHNDTRSFIHLPGKRSVEDVLQHGNDVRGGAVKQHDPLLKADYIADTKLPTDMGNFRMRAYKVRGHDDAYSNTNAMEPIIIYAADKPPFGKDGQLLEEVPIRIHDQCLTSEVFRSRR
jgi:GTP cyclohydrolase II